MKNTSTKSDHKRSNRFADYLDRKSKEARIRGLSDLDFLDQIPDNEIVDEPVPFPYGGDAKFNTWS